jgi:hypothetical protein
MMFNRNPANLTGGLQGAVGQAYAPNPSIKDKTGMLLVVKIGMFSDRRKLCSFFVKRVSELRAERFTCAVLRQRW